MLIQSFIERLRPLLLGIKSWDYIVLWKLSNDQRFIEWMDCCCAGSENYCTDNGGDQDDAVNCTAAANLTPCRDVMFPHARVIQCDLLDQLPSSMLLGSGIHGQTLQSNQVSWLNFVHNSDSSLSHETIGTRVLIPLSLGLLELFVAKQVPEDEQVIEFIRAQCNIFLEPQTGMNNSDSFSSDPNSQNNYQQQIPHENIDLPNDISIERIHLGNNTNNKNNNSSSNGIFVEGGTAYDQPNIFSPSTMDNGILLNGVETTNVPSNSSRRGRRWNNNMDQPSEDQFMIKDDTFLCENNNVRSDDSEPNEDDDEDIDAKYMRRRTNGKGPQSKNLMAERKRRKKLNDRLYSLRALVPKISKLDRASILGDAIDYVKELQKQVEDLQLELEQQPSGDDINEDPTRDDAHVDNSYVPPPSVLSVVTHQNGKNKRDHLENTNGNIAGFVLHNTEYSSGNNSGCLDTSKQYCQDTDSTNPGKVPQQMEPQVEVYELEGNELVVKVFSEHKSGGFVRLMEVLTSLGFQVTNVNATRHTCLVSTIFQLERRKDEGTVEADHVKESLLELTRNPSTILLWRSNNITINSNIAAAAAANHFSSENGYNMMQMDSTGGYDHHHIHSHLNHGRQIMNPQYDHHLHRMPH